MLKIRLKNKSPFFNEMKKGSYCGSCASLVVHPSCTSDLYTGLENKLGLGPTCCCLSSQELMMCSGTMVCRGRIRASCAGDDSNGCADCDQGAGAEASNGAASSCAGSASCRSSSWWYRCAANWSGGLSKCLCRSEQDCRGDQNFLHGISFLVKQWREKVETDRTSIRL